MNTELTEEEWFNLFNGFIKNMEDIFDRKLELIRPDEEARIARMEKAKTLMKDVAVMFRDKFTLEDFKLAQSMNVSELSEHTGRSDGREALIITGAEMVFLRETYNSSQISSAEDADEAIDASKTVKDSIEKLFKWMPWHKAILDGLNEILSLGRGI